MGILRARERARENAIASILFLLSFAQSKNWKDLLTDEPFARKDIIVLQDPQNLDKFNISKFLHLKKEWKVGESDKVDAKYFLKNANAETEDILAELSKTYKGGFPFNRVHSRNVLLYMIAEMACAHVRLSARGMDC